MYKYLLPIAGNSIREVEFHFKSIHDAKFSIKLSAIMIPQIINLFPQSRILKSNWNHLTCLQLADLDYTLPGKIDLLLSAQVTDHLLLDQSRKSSLHEPVARLSLFGWIITSPAGYPHSKSKDWSARINLVISQHPFSFENLWNDSTVRAKVICHCTSQTYSMREQKCVFCDLQKF